MQKPLDLSPSMMSGRAATVFGDRPGPSCRSTTAPSVAFRRTLAVISAGARPCRSPLSIEYRVIPAVVLDLVTGRYRRTDERRVAGNPIARDEEGRTHAMRSKNAYDLGGIAAWPAVERERDLAAQACCVGDPTDRVAGRRPQHHSRQPKREREDAEPDQELDKLTPQPAPRPGLAGGASEPPDHGPASRGVMVGASNRTVCWPCAATRNWIPPARNDESIRTAIGVAPVTLTTARSPLTVICTSRREPTGRAAMLSLASTV